MNRQKNAYLARRRKRIIKRLMLLVLFVALVIAAIKTIWSLSINSNNPNENSNLNEQIPNDMYGDIVYDVDIPNENNIPPFSHPQIGPSGIPENYATLLTNEQANSYDTLVNRHFKLPEDFSPGDLSVINAINTYGLPNMWITMRQSAARALEDLLAAAELDGHTIIIISGYRSYQTQAGIHNNAIMSSGEEEARRFSARPGHSEHQLGLAVDLSTFGLGGHLSSTFSSTPEGAWVADNAHNFGFIVRYPQDRESDTGFIYEPWHLRYVGVEIATAMFGSGLVLEEFLHYNN